MSTKHRLKAGTALILAVLCLALSGCGKQVEDAVPTAQDLPSESVSPTPDLSPDSTLPVQDPVWPHVFTDDLDREVSLEAPPTRVAALTSSFAQVWMLAGGSVAAVPNDAWTSYDMELDPSVADLGSPHDLSLEALLAAEPDFVIATGNVSGNLDLMPTLEQMGIPAAYFDVNTFEDYLRMLGTCAGITGRQDLLEENGFAVQAQVNAVLERAAGRDEHPTVLCLRASASSVVAKGAGDTVLAELLSGLGCVNIADMDNSLLEELSLERVVEADPDYIFIAPMGTNEEKIAARLESDLTSNPAWSGLTAVKEGRVHTMDRMLYTLKPNERWGEAYEGLERILFGDAAG